MTQPTAILLNDRAILTVHGADAESFLQGIVSLDVEALQAGDACFGCLLTPQGKILFDFFMIRDQEGFVIDCHKPASEALLKRLTLYKLRAAVSLEIKTDWAVSAVIDGAIEDTPKSAIVFNDPRLLALGQRIIGDRQMIEALSDAAPNPSLYAVHCIAHCVPSFGTAFGSDEIFPMDVNYDLLNGVNYKKGCFVGQEVSSRMKRKGDARKRTVLITYEGTPPQSGTDITAGASTLGTIISTAPQKGLGLVRLDRWKKATAGGDSVMVNEHGVQITIPDYLK